MQKEYYIKRTSLWFLAKLAIYVLGVIVSYQHIYVIFLIDFAFSWVAHGIDPITSIKRFGRTIKDILFNNRGINFIIGFGRDKVTVKEEDFFYDEIKRYEISRGGSEPYLILKNGRRVDFHISWLTKEEQLEIAKHLQKRINDSQESR